MAFIECCLHNVSSDARTTLNESDHTVREAICLERCGECDEGSFLVVDGTFRTGSSHGDLLDSLEDLQTESDR